MPNARPSLATLEHHDSFVGRHLGLTPADREAMLAVVGAPSVDALLDRAVPTAIRNDDLPLPPPASEVEVLARLRERAARNDVRTALIGMGYFGTITPPVILRNVLENPAWYTAYTPYQPEISQGRLEALLNFQTTVTDLTGLPLANASMLDEATAAAEAMAMCRRLSRHAGGVFFVDADTHPQTVAVLRTRAEPIGITLTVGDPELDLDPHAAFLATRQENSRALPGRLVGVSTDSAGRPALRLALQTREQHIRREKATSNICTAQVLLANIAGLY